MIQGLPKVLTLISTFAIVCTRAWFPGVEQRFVEETLIDAGSLGLPSDGIVAAFGDANADQLLDLFHLSYDQRTVSTYVWSRTQYRWSELVQARIRTPSDFVITNVVPGDFNYDGRLDLLLMGSQNPGGWWRPDEALDMKVYFQQSNGSYVEIAVAIPSAGVAQPTVLDAGGDMTIDLLGIDSTKAKSLRLWKNVYALSNGSELFNVGNAPLDVSQSADKCRIPSPHFNAFIDLDGDCLADIFLTCQNDEDAPDRLSYQIWINSKNGGFRLARKGDLPRGTKSVGFGDMDRDGTIDMIITSCTSRGDCALSVAYNEQVPLCSGTSSDSSLCRDPEALCVADPNFSFDLSPSPDNSMFTSVSISNLLPGTSLITESTAFRGQHPTPPAIGDYNIDGYPDLLLLTTNPSGGRQVNLLQSRPCDARSCSPGEVKARRRAFQRVVTGAEALSNIADAESAHWIDLDDDGSLDIMVQRSGNSGAARKVTFVKNNFFHDAFFLKAITLNGACQTWCEPPEGSRYRPYGSSYSGATYKFSVLDPNGARRSTQVGQLAQSTYLSLGTPYSYFGLGRTNNYVENLFIGVTRHQSRHYINIEGLIPNSQIVIVPWQPRGANDPSAWTRELFLHPGDWIPWVTVVLGAAIILLGVIVVSLHINERRADELERRARLLSLNYRSL